MLVRLVTGCSGWTRSAWWARSRTRRCAGGATSGSPPACSTLRETCSPPRRGRGARSPRRVVDGSIHKAPCGGEGTEKVRLTGENSAGSGRRPPTRTASRSAGGSRRQPQRRDLLAATLEGGGRPGDCSTRSRPCTSTAATTTAWCAARCRARIAQVVVAQVRPKEGTTRRAPTRVPLSGVAGRWSGPTRGSRTTASRRSCPRESSRQVCAAPTASVPMNNATRSPTPYGVYFHDEVHRLFEQSLKRLPTSCPTDRYRHTALPAWEKGNRGGRRGCSITGVTELVPWYRRGAVQSGVSPPQASKSYTYVDAAAIKTVWVPRMSSEPCEQEFPGMAVTTNRALALAF